MSPIVQGMLTILIGVGGCVAYFFFLQPADRQSHLPGQRAQPRAQHQPRQPGQAVAVPVARDPRARALPRLSGDRLVLPLAVRPLGQRVRRRGQLRAARRRPRVPPIGAQQPAVGARGAGARHLLRPSRGAAHRPAALGQHRKVADLHAHGDQLRGRLADLEVRLRQRRRHRPAERAARHDGLREPHRPAPDPVLEQLLPHAHPGLDPDGLRHGDPVGRSARHSRGDDRGRHHRRRLAAPDLLPDQDPPDHGHDRRGVDDHHHPSAQGVRHRLHDDGGQLRHADPAELHDGVPLPGRRARHGGRLRHHASGCCP